MYFINLLISSAVPWPRYIQKYHLHKQLLTLLIFLLKSHGTKNLADFSKCFFKVACSVRVACLKESNHRFFTVFPNKFLKHVFNIILKLNNHPWKKV